VGVSDDFRQVYVNGVKATRAKSTGPLPGAVETTTGYTTTDTNMQNWGNKDKIEFVYHCQDWQVSRILVSNISGTNVTMKEDGWSIAKSMTAVNKYNHRMIYMENAYELLDAEGEWYLNSSTDYLYYKPKSGENMSSATVEVPVVEKLVDISGTSGTSYVANIQFEGIMFKLTNWTHPTYYALVGWQGTGYFDTMNDLNNRIWHAPEAAVSMGYARYIKVERCSFNKLGALGIRISDGTQNSRIRGCVFDGIAADGIYFFTTNRNESDGNKIVKYLTINNNYITNVGVDYKMASAVYGEAAQNVSITHNKIENVPYDGIQLRAGCNSAANMRKAHDISYNHIKNSVNALGDGGAIYTNGEMYLDSTSSRSTITNNYIQGVGSGPWCNALYTDEGSSYWSVSNNVCDGITTRWIHIWKSTIHDEIVNGNYTNSGSIRNDGTNCTITNTTTYSGSNYPAGAQTIINSAGLESAYSDIQPTPTPTHAE